MGAGRQMIQPLRFEFADSEVAAVWRREDEAGGRGLAELALRFSAAQVLRADAAMLCGFVRGHMRAVELACRGRGLPLPGAEHVGRLAQGRIGLDGAWHALVALPVVMHGPLDIELEFANGARLAFTAERVAVSLPDHPVFVESLAC